MTSLRYFFHSLPWLAFFTAVILSWYFYIKARNKERLALIEKNVDASKIYAKPAEPFRFPWLKVGIIITGICLGITFIFYLAFTSTNKMLNDGLGALVILAGFLFGGISMIIASFVDKPQKKE